MGGATAVEVVAKENWTATTRVAGGAVGREGEGPIEDGGFWFLVHVFFDPNKLV